MHVVSTAALPIDLSALVTAALPGSTVDVPSEGHVGVDRVDLANADALVCLLLDRIDARVLDRAPKLKVVANCAVGIDNLDLLALAARGIVATNTPDVLTEATAEMAFALMLAAARRVGEGERMVRAGQWNGWELDQLLGQSLLGKTLGIVGFGRIGQAMARRGHGFGMRVIYASSRKTAPSPSAPTPSAPTPSAPTPSVPTPSAPAPPAPTPERVDLDALFQTADVISLHCPLTPQTANLVNARTLSLVKPTAVLVNTARGGCVDEAALADALASGRLFAAGLDVYAREPEIHPRLRTSERVVLAPHLGSATTETRTQMARLCADAVIAVLSGRMPSTMVRRDAMTGGKGEGA
ncbi:MAG: 2-hydroxyacid dehydrogenase [Kofleriaceae bacterium]